jgi:hypothetical protein
MTGLRVAVCGVCGQPIRHSTRGRCVHKADGLPFSDLRGPHVAHPRPPADGEQASERPLR